MTSGTPVFVNIMGRMALFGGDDAYVVCLCMLGKEHWVNQHLLFFYLSFEQNSLSALCPIMFHNEQNGCFCLKLLMIDHKANSRHTPFKIYFGQAKAHHYGHVSCLCLNGYDHCHLSCINNLDLHSKPLAKFIVLFFWTIKYKLWIKQRTCLKVFSFLGPRLSRPNNAKKMALVPICFFPLGHASTNST